MKSQSFNILEITSSSSQQERNATENVNKQDICSPGEKAEIKTKLINMLFQSLFSWKKNQASFADVFHLIVNDIFRNSTDTQFFKVGRDELKFEVVKDSFVESDNATFTCLLKCPVKGCNEECTTSFKAIL